MGEDPIEFRARIEDGDDGPQLDIEVSANGKTWESYTGDLAALVQSQQYTARIESAALTALTAYQQNQREEERQTAPVASEVPEGETP